MHTSEVISLNMKVGFRLAVIQITNEIVSDRREAAVDL